MEQVEVEILGQVITHRYGVLNTGDVLRTDSEFAKHLVDDCGAAKYRDDHRAAAGDAAAPAIADPAPTPAVEPAPAARPVRTAKAK